MASEHLSASLKISLATLGGAFFSFLTLWLLAQNTDLETFGAFSVAWAGVQAFIPLAIVGIPQYVLHRYKAIGPAAAGYLPSAARGLGLFGGLSVALYLAWLEGSGLDEGVRHAAWILSVWLLLLVPVIAVYSKFQYQHRIPALIYWPLLQVVPRALVVVLVLQFGRGILHVVVGFVLVLFPLTWVSVRELLSLRREAPVMEASRSATLKDLLSEAWPYGISEWLEKLDLRLVVPLVGILGGQADAAYIAVSGSLLTVIYLLPSSLLQRYFLPHLHEWSVHEPARLYRFANQWIFVLTIGSLLVVPTLWALSGVGIPFLYGEDYVAAIKVFDIMVLALPISLISGVVAKTFLRPTEIRSLALLQGVGVILLLIGAWLIYPLEGLLGIAWVFVLARALLLLGMAVAARHNYLQRGIADSA